MKLHVTRRESALLASVNRFGRRGGLLEEVGHDLWPNTPATRAACSLDRQTEKSILLREGLIRKFYSHGLRLAITPKGEQALLNGWYEVEELPDGN